MKKKLSKEKELKTQIAALISQVKSRDESVEQFRSILNRIHEIVFPSQSTYSAPFSDMPLKIAEAFILRKMNEGRYSYEFEHIRSLERILRWTINPETAKDDEKIARFEEERKRVGF